MLSYIQEQLPEQSIPHIGLHLMHFITDDSAEFIEVLSSMASIPFRRDAHRGKDDFRTAFHSAGLSSSAFVTHAKTRWHVSVYSCFTYIPDVNRAWVKNEQLAWPMVFTIPLRVVAFSIFWAFTCNLLHILLDHSRKDN